MCKDSAKRVKSTTNIEYTAMRLPCAENMRHGPLYRRASNGCVLHKCQDSNEPTHTCNDASNRMSSANECIGQYAFIVREHFKTFDLRI